MPGGVVAEELPRGEPATGEHKDRGDREADPRRRVV